MNASNDRALVEAASRTNRWFADKRGEWLTDDEPTHIAQQLRRFAQGDGDVEGQTLCAIRRQNDAFVKSSLGRASTVDKEGKIYLGQRKGKRIGVVNL